MSLYAVVDPATGDVVKEYPTGTDEQIEQALASASRHTGNGPSPRRLTSASP